MVFMRGKKISEIFVEKSDVRKPLRKRRYSVEDII